MSDWIEPVEAAYELAGDLQSWLNGVLARTAPHLDRGDGVLAYGFSRRASLPRLNLQASHAAGPGLLAAHAAALSSAAGHDARRVIEGAGTAFSSLSEFLFTRLPDEGERYFAQTGLRDAIGLSVETATGYGISIVAPARERCATRADERNRWTRIAAHLGAGLRLRLALLADTTAPAGAEAVFDPAARLVDASETGSGKRAREILQEAVRRRERARGRRVRADADSALALWEGLVDGRWSLVDRFESDGKRFVVAHRNDPDVGDPRGLTRRERQVAEYLGIGRSLKEIAYALGVSSAAISNATQRAARKLGLSSGAELAQIFAPGGLRERLEEVEIGGEALAIGAALLLDEASLAALTRAERDVALDLLRGATTAAIAARRSASHHTVETQVKSIYAKLGVGSRVELAARVSGAPGEAGGQAHTGKYTSRAIP